MKFTIKTETLQEMVGKVIKCASDNKLIPITSLLSIKVDNNVLYLTTTDATNYFYVKATTPIECEPFEVSVIADIFAKLIQKTTSENITIEYDEEKKTLTVVGNGTYILELPLDEKGKPIKFPTVKTDNKVKCGTIKVSSIKDALSYNKVALGEGTTYPFLSHYYCADKIITTNQTKVCETDEKMFDTPKVLSQQVVELLGVVSGDTIDVYEDENKLIFETETDYIINALMARPSDFPVDSIQKLIDSDFAGKCTISKDVILNILDRLSLFMSTYDKKGLDLTVTKDGIVIKTLKGSGVEVVPFISAENIVDYNCRINIEIFRALLATYSTDNIDLYYGNPVAIKFVADKVIQLAALMEE